MILAGRLISWAAETWEAARPASQESCLERGRGSRYLETGLIYDAKGKLINTRMALR